MDNRERAHNGSLNPHNNPAKYVPPPLLTGKETEAAVFRDLPVSGSNGIHGQAGGCEPVPGPRGYGASSVRRPAASAGNGSAFSYLDVHF